MRSHATAGVAGSSHRVSAYYELLKPRVSFMVALTTAAGFYLGSTPPVDWLALFWAVLATALLAGGSVCLNQIMERHPDARMTRTAGRPLPSERVSVSSATLFGVSLIAVATMMLLATSRVGGRDPHPTRSFVRRVACSG